VVSDKTLRSLATGPLMGIPSAPNVLDPRADSTASWTVCDWRDTAVPLSLLRAGDLTTAVIAGEDMLSGGDELGSSRAVLVRPAGKPGELWLLYRNTRAEVGTADFAAQSALGITPALVSAAPVISPSLLYAITVSPALTAPQLAERGQPSPAVLGSNVGDVLAVGNAAGSRTYYLVGRAGVQQIGPVPAQMMINTGSSQKVLDDPAAVQKLPRSGLIDDGRFPSQVPTLDSPASVCWNWTKRSGELTANTRVFTGSRLPITEAGRSAAVTLLPNSGTEDQATESVMRPGYGWYARTTGSDADSPTAEGLMWIDPNGTRYPIDAVINASGGGNAISYDPTVKALGFDSVAPTPIPWSVARLYAPGATLSIRNAQVLQGTITAISQVPSPSVTPGAAPPPPPPPPPAASMEPAPADPAPVESAPPAPSESDPAADPASVVGLEPAPAGN
jgi:type VII secretion protein EccB